MFFTALVLPRIKLITSCCLPLTGTSFKRVIPDSGPASNNPEKVRKLLLCTGKVYYELAKVRVLEHEHDLLLPPLFLFMIFSILAFFQLYFLFAFSSSCSVYCISSYFPYFLLPFIILYLTSLLIHHFFLVHPLHFLPYMYRYFNFSSIHLAL